jgi:hypothetical protein
MRQVENGPNCLPMLNVVYPAAPRTHLLYWILDEWGRWTDVSAPAAESLVHSDTHFLFGFTGSNKPNGSRAQFSDGCSMLSMTITSTRAWMVRTFSPGCSGIAVNSDGAVASATGGATLIPVLANWVPESVGSAFRRIGSRSDGKSRLKPAPPMRFCCGLF